MRSRAAFADGVHLARIPAICNYPARFRSISQSARLLVTLMQQRSSSRRFQFQRLLIAGLLLTAASRAMPSVQAQSVRTEPGRKVAEKLFELGRTELGQLTQSDWDLFLEVSQPATHSQSTPQPDQTVPRKPLRASTLNWLCTNSEAVALLTHRGVILENYELIGRVDLRFGRLQFPLIFRNCRMQEGIELHDAHIHELHVVGSEVAVFHADGMVVENDVLLKDGFRCWQGVDLVGAEIGGKLDCDGAAISSESGVAFNGAEIVVDGDVFMRYGFECVGEVDLHGARIGGDLQMDEANLTSTGPDTLFADGLKVEGNLFLRYGFHSAGQVSLVGARITGDFDGEFSEFQNRDGAALSARRLHVDGEVRVSDAVFSGDCDLTDSRISGNLNCTAATFERSMILSGTKVGGAFVWTSINSQPDTLLDLRSARLTRLKDDQESWPAVGNLFLDGCVYDTIDAESPNDADSRIDWLRRQEQGPSAFRPQPYGQLALVLKQLGQFGDSEEILIAREADSSGALPVSERLLHELLGLSIGYGYRPWRAMWIGISIIAFGALVFAIGSRAGLIAATKEVEHVFEGEIGYRLSDDYPRFNALVYSLDMFVPLLDLQQATYWLPSSSRGTTLVNSRWYRLTAGGVLRFYLGFHIYLGWTLTTLLAVGLSGLVVQ